MKDKVVTLGVFQDYYGDFKNIRDQVGEKVKNQVGFPLGVDDNYVPDTLEVVEVTE